MFCQLLTATRERYTLVGTGTVMTSGACMGFLVEKKLSPTRLWTTVLRPGIAEALETCECTGVLG